MTNLVADCPSQHDADRLYECSLLAGHDGDHTDFGREGEREVSWPNVCDDCGVGKPGPVEADGHRYCAACLGPDPEPAGDRWSTR